MSYTIRSAGTWLQQLGPVGDLRYSWGENGCEAASWSMMLTAGFMHSAVFQGALVEVFYCGVRVWYGVMIEPDREAWTFTAKGIAETLNDVAAIGADPQGGYQIGISSDATAAIARGFMFSIATNVPDALDTDDYIGQIEGNTLRLQLDSYAAITGNFWMVDESGLLSIVLGPPTIPEWALTPGVPALGVTTENYYSRTYLQFHNAAVFVDGEYVKTTVYADAPNNQITRWGLRERAMEFDVDERYDPMDESVAQVFVDRVQAEAKASPTQGVQLVEGQVTTTGGTLTPLAFLRPWQMVRHFAVLDVPGARDPYEWVISKVDIDTVAQTANIQPRMVAPRTLAQIIESLSAPPTGDYAHYQALNDAAAEYFSA